MLQSNNAYNFCVIQLYISRLSNQARLAVTCWLNSQYLQMGNLLVHYISAVKCPALSLPQNGGLVPAACHQGQREFGQRCVPYCKHGFKLVGPSVKYCQSNRKWSSDATSICVPSMFLTFFCDHSQVVIYLF